MRESSIRKAERGACELFEVKRLPDEQTFRDAIVLLWRIAKALEESDRERLKIRVTGDVDKFESPEEYMVYWSRLAVNIAHMEHIASRCNSFLGRIGLVDRIHHNHPALRLVVDDTDINQKPINHHYEYRDDEIGREVQRLVSACSLTPTGSRNWLAFKAMHGVVERMREFATTEKLRALPEAQSPSRGGRRL